MKENNEQEIADLFASEPALAKGSKHLLMYLKNLNGEAEIEDLRLVLKATPIMDEHSLVGILDEIEEAYKIERTGSNVKLRYLDKNKEGKN